MSWHGLYPYTQHDRTGPKRLLFMMQAPCGARAASALHELKLLHLQDCGHAWSDIKPRQHQKCGKRHRLCVQVSSPYISALMQSSPSNKGAMPGSFSHHFMPTHASEAVPRELEYPRSLWRHACLSCPSEKRIHWSECLPALSGRGLNPPPVQLLWLTPAPQLQHAEC